ncbi:hypothetical protein MTO96_007779 [Rhipicephalus appendiculatus]
MDSLATPSHYTLLRGGMVGVQVKRRKTLVSIERTFAEEAPCIVQLQRRGILGCTGVKTVTPCATGEVGLSALGALNGKQCFLRACTPNRGNCLAYKKKRNRPVCVVGFRGKRRPTPDCPELNRCVQKRGPLVRSAEA